MAGCGSFSEDDDLKVALGYNNTKSAISAWVGSLLVPDVVLVNALSVSPRVLSTVNVVIVAME